MITECALAAHDTSEGAEFGEPAAEVDAVFVHDERALLGHGGHARIPARRSTTGTGGAPGEAITTYIITNTIST